MTIPTAIALCAVALGITFVLMALVAWMEAPIADEPDEDRTRGLLPPDAYR